MLDMLKASSGCMLNRLWVTTVSKRVILFTEDKGKAGAKVVQLVTLSKMYWKRIGNQGVIKSLT